MRTWVVGHVVELLHAGPGVEPAAVVGNGRVEKVAVELRKVLKARNGELRLQVTILAPLALETFSLGPSLSFFRAIGTK